MNFVKVLQRIEGAATVRTVATDSMTRSSAQLLPKAFPSAELIDGEPLLRRARRVKTPEEVDAIRASVARRRALAGRGGGGARSRRHGAAAHGRLHGGDGVGGRDDARDAGRRLDHLARAPVASRRAGTRRCEPGDLVAFDAGVMLGGYVGELGRTHSVDGDAAIDA